MTQTPPPNMVTPNREVPLSPQLYVPPPVAPKPDLGSSLKEIIAALLSVMIVGITVYFMYIMFSAPDNVGQTLWQHQSAILQGACGLAGTVIGYYFGRIPAERAASTAQQAANSAQQSLVSTTAVAQQAATNENRIRTQVADLRRQVSTTPLGGGASTDTNALRAQLEQRLDQILGG